LIVKKEKRKKNMINQETKKQLIDILRLFPQNINRDGFNYPIKKCTQILGMKERTLRKYINELKKEGIIERTGNYETGKHSQRIRFLNDPPTISVVPYLQSKKVKT
jgi:Fic family protein